MNIHMHIYANSNVNINTHFPLNLHYFLTESLVLMIFQLISYITKLQFLWIILLSQFHKRVNSIFKKNLRLWQWHTVLKGSTPGPDLSRNVVSFLLSVVCAAFRSLMCYLERESIPFQEALNVSETDVKFYRWIHYWQDQKFFYQFTDVAKSIQ